MLCLLVISGLQTQSWALEQQAVRADRQGDPSLAQDLRLRQADSRLLADRWLVNYNLGTTYLNAGDLQNAHKYLSRASKKMPFILETKMTEPQAVLAGCQVNYNLALVTIKTSEVAIFGCLPLPGLRILVTKTRDIPAFYEARGAFPAAGSSFPISKSNSYPEDSMQLPVPDIIGSRFKILC